MIATGYQTRCASFAAGPCSEDTRESPCEEGAAGSGRREPEGPGQVRSNRMTARGDANDIETLRRILATGRVIAVVGLSAEWYRPSFFAAKYMQAHGYRIVPVNPRYPSILGETCYPALQAIPSAIARTVDIV